MRDYTDPVAKLLTYRRLETRGRNERWPNYLALGFTEAHVPDLIHMAADDDLHRSGQESLEVWAPVHAWRALGQLRAEAAAQPLVRLFDQLTDDDWLTNELPDVFSLIGPSTIPTLAAFLGDEAVEEFGRISVPGCLEKIAQTHSDARDDSVRVLTRQLEKYETNGPVLNALLVSSLTELGAVEAIEVIRKAFSENRVDLTVHGDLEDVEMDLGLRKYRSTPRPRLNLLGEGFDFRDLQPLPNIPLRHPAKIGRNEPCPCGSGKKFKKCCLQ